MGDTYGQTLLVHLDGRSLPAEVYKQYDLCDLEDQLDEVLSQTGVGKCDGNEFGPEVVTLFLCGPDAEAIFRVVEPILRAYPLCQNSLILIGSASAGSQDREVRLPRL